VTEKAVLTHDTCIFNLLVSLWSDSGRELYPTYLWDQSRSNFFALAAAWDVSTLNAKD